MYANVYVSMRVSVIHTQSHTHTHTHIYIYMYICIWVCAGLSCDRIMMSYPLPVYFEKSSMDCLHPPSCLRHLRKAFAESTGDEQDTKWPESGPQMVVDHVDIPCLEYQRISETSQFLETSNWRVPERNRGFDWGEATAMLTQDEEE